MKQIKSRILRSQKVPSPMRFDDQEKFCSGRQGSEKEEEEEAKFGRGTVNVDTWGNFPYGPGVCSLRKLLSSISGIN